MTIAALMFGSLLLGAWLGHLAREWRLARPGHDSSSRTPPPRQ